MNTTNFHIEQVTRTIYQIRRAPLAPPDFTVSYRQITGKAKGAKKSWRIQLAYMPNVFTFAECDTVEQAIEIGIPALIEKVSQYLDTLKGYVLNDSTLGRGVVVTTGKPLRFS